MYSRLAKHVLKQRHFSQNGSWTPDDFFDIFANKINGQEEEEEGEDDESEEESDEEGEESETGYYDETVITSQPECTEKLLPALAEPEEFEENNNDSVTIREMTEKDVTFAARLLVEASRDIYKWTVGNHKLVNVFDLARTSLERCPTKAYQHRFIALLDKQPAGVITVVLKDDPTPKIGCMEACSALGCFRASCFLHMRNVLTYKPKSSAECYIDHFCVDLPYRNMGIGRMLLNYVELEAKQWGCQNITLWCTSDSRVKSLFERHGYTVTRNVDGLCYTYCTTGLRKWCKMQKELI